MKRVVILGIPGAGKSTFARRLGEQLKVPVHHLDKYFWKPGWKASDEQSWHLTLESLIAQDTWILDGNYRRTIPLRLERADTAILLDVPRRVALTRVLKRIFMYRNGGRPDMTEGCHERWGDRHFLSYIWRYHQTIHPEVMELLRDFEALPGRHVIYLNGGNEAEAWLADLEVDLLRQR